MARLLHERTFVLAVAAAALASGLTAVWIGLDLGGARATLWVDDVSTPAAAAIACLACLRARARHSGRMRLFWTLLSCATASWTAAELIWGVYALILNEVVPSPSWADVGYLLAIPLTIAAVIAHPGLGGSHARRARSVLDGMVVATALLFLSWMLVLGPLWRSSDSSTAAGIVTLAYPFGDVLILFVVFLTIRGMTGDRRSLWCLSVGLAAMAVADSTYAYLTEVVSYSSSSANLIDAGWVVAYLAIALAAFSSRVDSAQALMVNSRDPSLASLLSPLVTMLVALLAAAVEIRLGNHIDHVARLSLFALIALVLVRQGLALLELLDPRAARPDSVRERVETATLGRPASPAGPGGHS